MRFAIVVREVAIASIRFEVTGEGWECERGDNWALPGQSLRSFDEQVLRELSTSGPATGNTLKYMRDRLRISQADLGEFIGVDGERIERWEADEEPVPPLVWAAVVGLALDLPVVFAPRAITVIHINRKPETGSHAT